MDPTLQIDGRAITITHPDRVVFPDAGLTKLDVVNHYVGVASVMLPHLRGRPTTLQRFPEGIGGQGFYQKEAPTSLPAWIRRVEVPLLGEGGTQQQVVCEDAATLVYLANLGTLTPHVWLSREGHLDRPDRMIFDLDPSTDDFSLVCEAARLTATELDRVGLAPHLMTTGSRGLHVVTPIRPELRFDAVAEIADAIAARLADAHPDRLTVEFRKASRHGRLFVDALRNRWAQTAVAPYSVRPRASAPVATPIDWDELGGLPRGAESYTVGNLAARLEGRGDPWRDIDAAAASLKRAAATYGSGAA